MQHSVSARRFMLGALAVVSLTSCGGNSSFSSPVEKAGAHEKPLFLVGVLASDASSCTTHAGRESVLLSKGVLDLAFSASYTATLLVGNQFQSATSTPNAPQTERVSLRSVEVALTTASGVSLGMYTVVGTGFVDTAADSSAYGGITVAIVPSTLHEGVSLQGTEAIVATIKVSGEALDGTLLTSSALTFPIDVCTGCLVQYPPSAADATVPPGSSYRCATYEPIGEDRVHPPCILGQDNAFSCTVCAASLEICRDPAQNPAYR